MKMNKKGFTLIEMLVVIAIIAVLVSIVIPVVGNSTEKAKLAADAANIRAAVAEVMTEALGDGIGKDAEGNTLTIEKEVTLKSSCDFSLLGSDFTDIGGIAGTAIKTAKGTNSSVIIYWNATLNGGSGGADVKAKG